MYFYTNPSKFHYKVGRVYALNGSTANADIIFKILRNSRERGGIFSDLHEILALNVKAFLRSRYLKISFSMTSKFVS